MEIKKKTFDLFNISKHPITVNGFFAPHVSSGV
jgi:hypothetical protein